jgi:hypothetical protein
LEFDLHKQRIDDAKTVRAFLRDNVTSKEFHSWRATRMQQQHRTATDLVSQAKAALAREHGLDEQGIEPDPWDNSGRGLAASLLHELEKRILIDRRNAARPTSIFVTCMVNFFRAREARLAGTRAAVLVSNGVIDPLAEMPVGRFRIRTFHDATEAAEWLHPDADSPSMDRRAPRQNQTPSKAN